MQSISEVHERFRLSSVYIWNCFHVMRDHIDHQFEILAKRLDSDSPPSAENVSELHHYLRCTLGNTTRYSLFVLLLGLCEHTIVRFCKIKAGDQLKALYDRVKQHKRESRLSYHLRLLNELGVPTERIVEETALLEHSMRIRHCVAHAFGDVDAMKEPDVVENAVESTNGVCISADRHVFINDEAIKRTRTAVVRVVETLAKALGHRVDLRLPT